MLDLEFLEEGPAALVKTFDFDDDDVGPRAEGTDTAEVIVLEVDPVLGPKPWLSYVG